MSNTEETLAKPKGPTTRWGKYARPTYTQAQRIIAKFGGPARFASAVGIDRVTAYHWCYARPYGADGLIPSSQIDAVMRAARSEGIFISPEDWIPTRAIYAPPSDVQSDESDSGSPEI